MGNDGNYSWKAELSMCRSEWGDVMEEGSTDHALRAKVQH